MFTRGLEGVGIKLKSFKWISDTLSCTVVTFCIENQQETRRKNQKICPHIRLHWPPRTDEMAYCYLDFRQFTDVNWSKQTPKKNEIRLSGNSRKMFHFKDLKTDKKLPSRSLLVLFYFISFLFVYFFACARPIWFSS